MGDRWNSFVLSLRDTGSRLTGGPGVIPSPHQTNAPIAPHVYPARAPQQNLPPMAPHVYQAQPVYQQPQPQYQQLPPQYRAPVQQYQQQHYYQQPVQQQQYQAPAQPTPPGGWPSQDTRASSWLDQNARILMGPSAEAALTAGLKSAADYSTQKAFQQEANYVVHRASNTIAIGFRHHLTPQGAINSNSNMSVAEVKLFNRLYNADNQNRAVILPHEPMTVQKAISMVALKHLEALSTSAGVADRTRGVGDGDGKIDLVEIQNVQANLPNLRAPAVNKTRGW
jgi:hypothetical protein